MSTTKSISLLDPAILVPALRDALIKLDPRQLIRARPRAPRERQKLPR